MGGVSVLLLLAAAEFTPVGLDGEGGDRISQLCILSVVQSGNGRWPVVLKQLVSPDS